MASYNELNALIDAYINRNGVQAITGQILNGVLKAMVEQLGRGYTIMGAATPTTDPGTPDGPECYFASATGTYTDFDGLQVVPGELAILCYTPSDGWTKATIYEGFQEVGATIDGNVGTPSVGVSYTNGVLSFDFRNLKGNTGDPAGFGTIGADITGGVGTPGVSVESSGPATAKNLQFHFTNLKGETGVTSVVATVDNTTGTPACTVSLVGQQLTLAFTGLKGAQGDTGSSVDYPFTIVNNLTTDDATQALSAAQGVVLDGKVIQLEAKLYDTGVEIITENKTATAGTTIGTSDSVFPVSIADGKTYKVKFTGDSTKITKITAIYSCDSTGNNRTVLISEPSFGTEYTLVANGDISYMCLYIHSSQIVSTTDFSIEITIGGGTLGDILKIRQDITDMRGDIADIQDVIYESISYGRSDFKSGYLQTHNATIGDTVNLPEDDTPGGPDPAADHLTFQVKKGELFRVSFKSVSNKYCRAFVLLDSNRKILAWANPQTNDGPQETYNTFDSPLEIRIESDGYCILQFTQADYNDNEQMSVVYYKQKSEDVPQTETIEVCAPDTIFAVVGDTLQLYYRSIFRCVDFSKYAVKVVCNIGAQYPRYYEVTPLAGNVGTHTLSFTIKDNNNNILGTKTVNLVVIPAGSNPASELNVLCLGASATQGGQWASELKRRLVGTGGTPVGNGKTNINFVGRMDVTFEGKQVNLEATGGYNFGSYINTITVRYRFTVSAENEPVISIGDVYSNNGNTYEIVEINISPGSGGDFSCVGTGEPQFSSGVLTKVSGTGSESIAYNIGRMQGNPFVYNGVIDMQQYADDYCNPQGAAHGRIDVIFTELFGNGTSVYTDDFTTRMSQMQTFINQVRAVFPNCKFCIGLFWNPDIRGGMGVNYGASGTWSDPYGIKYSNMNLCNALQKYITDNNLSDYVFILNWLNEFDEENDMQQTTKKVNVRSTVTEIFGVNGVHPATVGYYQMADTAWRLFVAKFCQP